MGITYRYSTSVAVSLALIPTSTHSPGPIEDTRSSNTEGKGLSH